MNIILSNGQKVNFIAGAELNLAQVRTMKETLVNEKATQTFFTSKNFYIRMNNSWYNGGINLSDKEMEGVSGLPVSNILDYINFGKGFTTKRVVELNEIDPTTLIAAQASIEAFSNASAGGAPKPATKAKAPASVPAEPKVAEIAEPVTVASLKRVMKKEALVELAKDVPLYLIKFTKARGQIEETLMLVEGDLEESITRFHKLHTANKTNTQFMV